MSEIQEVIDGIVAVQGEIFTPAGEKPIAERWDEPSKSVSQFPAFVNVERDDLQIQINGAHREQDRIIDMHLLFAKASTKYSVRSRRKWEEPVLQAFGKRYHLINCPQVNWARIEEVLYSEELQLGAASYVAASFALHVQVKDCFAASVNGPEGEYSYEYSAEYDRGVAA